jgi:hypothetical protein
MSVNSDREYAEALIIGAHNRLRPYIDDSFPDEHRHTHAIQDPQECIELYTKSMFKLLGIEFPEQHGLSFKEDKVNSFINNAYNEHPDFEYLDNLPRVIILTNFWEAFYSVGKYGSQDLNIRPQDIIGIEDIKLAIHHAQYCGKTAVGLFEYETGTSIEETPE